MAKKPIFVATHPRACSTAFERVFMTRTDELTCVHEPFGDAFYYGPERLSERFENDVKEREESGFGESTYKTIVDRLETEASEGKRLFIKDIIHYLFPPEGKPASIAPSLGRLKRGVGTSTFANGTPVGNGFRTVGEHGHTNGVNGVEHSSSNTPYPYDTQSEPNNPTVVPEALLKGFHFTFLIRHPSRSIPSYYRCTVPPLDEMTGFYHFMPSEAGYDEMRRFFDYTRSSGQIGPEKASLGKSVNGDFDGIEICVVDADDLLDNPEGIIKAYCNSVGLEFHPSMLEWKTEEDHQQAVDAFEKWKGFHEDAIDSSDLKPRAHKGRPSTPHEEDEKWADKFGPEAAKVIRETVDRNIADYEYLKQFALRA